MKRLKNAHNVFAHVTAPNASVYRAIMTVFRDAKSEYSLHLRPKDVLIGITAEGFQDFAEKDETSVIVDVDWLASFLEQLELWGNLRSYQDTVEVATVSDFMRKRLLYQMTAAGEAAEMALALFQERLTQPGEL